MEIKVIYFNNVLLNFISLINTIQLNQLPYLNTSAPIPVLAVAL